MKRFKFPAFMLALGLAVMSAFAFNNTSAEANKFSKTYYYIGSNSDAQVSLPANWILDGDPCGSGSSLPCTKVFTSNNRVDFDNHIAGYTTVAIANADASTKRP